MQRAAPSRWPCRASRSPGPPGRRPGRKGPSPSSSPSRRVPSPMRWAASSRRPSRRASASRWWWRNRPGAGGAIAARTVARVAPDGYTLMIGTQGTKASNASLMRNPGYDPVNDFTPLHGLAKIVGTPVCNPSRPWRNVAELVADAKQRPGRISFGSSGNGTVLQALDRRGHRACALSRQRAGDDRPTGRQHPPDVRVSESRARTDPRRPRPPACGRGAGGDASLVHLPEIGIRIWWRRFSPRRSSTERFPERRRLQDRRCEAHRRLPGSRRYRSAPSAVMAQRVDHQAEGRRGVGRLNGRCGPSHTA